VNFDFVVVGAGSAGCAVAGALGADARCSFCLIEAGPDYGAFYTSGMGSEWKPTPWRAVQGAARDALRRARFDV
jgi:choline dehydrogenase-like flavoprotein